MTTRTLSTFPTSRSAADPGAGWLEWLRRVLQAAETRRHLSGMEPRMLADIGLSRADALAEAHRAPWDLGPTRD